MTRSNRWPVAAALGLGLLGGLTVGDRLVGQPAVPAAPPALPRDWMSLAPVAKRALPAVVTIEGNGKAAAKPKLDDVDPGFGSGVLIDPAGFLLTTHHVVADTAAVTVTLHDGRVFTSKDIRRDPKSDLAVIKVEAPGPLPFLEFGDSDAMEVGDRVLALGAPFGLTGSVTQGVVSAKSRRNLNLNPVEEFVQFDAAVNPGNSGGPLVGMDGKLVGVTAAIKTRSGGFQGVGLAVSGNLARSVSAVLIKAGAVRRPSLGVAVAELDDATAARNKLKPGGGVVVTRVVPGGPGARANLGVGDVITGLAGKPVTDVREMQRVTLGLAAGQEVEVLVTRSGQLFRTKAVAEERADDPDPAPNPAPAGIDFDATGLTVADLTADLAGRMGVPKAAKGVVVTAVRAGGLAERSGVARGAVVLQVDRTPVATGADFRRAVEAAGREKGAVLHVLRPSGDVDFVILRGQ
jgi:serine protease Do